MIKVMKCHVCGCHMVYVEDKEAENTIKAYSFECSCGYGVFAPMDNPNIQEIEENEIIIATSEQKYRSALIAILDISFDYDVCKTVGRFKELVGEIRDKAKFALK